MPEQRNISRMHLDFGMKNFDFKVVLEGSNDQKVWFQILNDARVLNISNSEANYSYTDLLFESCQFSFYRLRLKSKVNPGLTSVSIEKESEYTPPVKVELDIETKHFFNNKKRNQTIVEIAFKELTAFTEIKLDVNLNFEFYRPLIIEGLVDSVKTDKGWKKSWSLIYTGTISSLEEPVFQFPLAKYQLIRTTISNYENQPIHINEATISCELPELVVRFVRPAKYFLELWKR